MSKAIIIEDEKPAARRLLKLLSTYDITIEATLHSLSEAGDWLDSNPDPDLIFLDIQLSDGLSFELFKNRSISSAIIFTTAYDEYALKAFKVNSIDYLLKPIGLDRFMQAVNKAMTRRPVVSAPVTTSEATKNYLLVKSEHKVYKIHFDDIQYIQSMREYVAYYTPDGRILSLGSLKGLEKELPTDQFIRIHKSYIVPIRKIKTLEGNLLHIGKEKCPVTWELYPEIINELIVFWHVLVRRRAELRVFDITIITINHFITPAIINGIFEVRVQPEIAKLFQQIKFQQVGIDDIVEVDNIVI